MSITRLDDGGQPAAVGPSLRDRKKRRTRERLYDAALQLFAERRYEDVTVDEICDRAEVGRATFFRFFGSKAGLLVEFNHRLAGRIGGRLSDGPDDDAHRGSCGWSRRRSPPPGVRARFRPGDMAREYIRNATASDLRDAAPPELFELVAGIVRSGQESGEFPPGPRCQLRGMDHSGLAVGDHRRLAGHRQRSQPGAGRPTIASASCWPALGRVDG